MLIRVKGPHQNPLKVLKAQKVRRVQRVLKVPRVLKRVEINS